MPTTTPKFSKRVCFNWGFHDATFDAEMGNPNRADPRGAQCNPLPPVESHAGYHEGYRMGYADFLEKGYRCDSSEDAWILSGLTSEDF